VQLVEDRLGEIQDKVGKEDASHIIPPVEISEQEISEVDENVVVPNPLPSTPVEVTTSTPDPALTSTGSQITPFQEVSDQGMPQGDEKDPHASTSIKIDTSTPGPALTRMERFNAFRRRSCKKYGTFVGLGYVFIYFPLKRFLVAIGDMIDRETLGDKTLRVPTFYSPLIGDDDRWIAGIFATCVATVFGAIHCIAWSFHFATEQERWAWRMSAILVSGLPISITALSFLPAVSVKPGNKTTWINVCHHFLWGIGSAHICFYIIARLVLLVLPFVALRALPPGAYVQIDWISFLPHI
jgi:hypothetical protein